MRAVLNLLIQVYRSFSEICDFKIEMICLCCVFRALKKKGNTPKYGLIFHSSFIGRAASQNKGRISRYLANKCSIASRIDCFSGEFTDLVVFLLNYIE